MPKKIGIDARFFGEAGPGRYTKNILSGLEELDKINTYYVFLTKRAYDLYSPASPNFIKVLADYHWYTWGEQLGFLLLVLSKKLDVFYVPHFNIPVLYPFSIVTAIPDLIMHTFSTERGTTLPKPYFKIKKAVYKLVVWWAVVRSKVVIVPSLDVMRDFIKVFPFINKNKYALAYEGVDKVFLTPPVKNTPVSLTELGVKNPYILYISSMYEHKNVPRLLHAFKLVKARYPDLNLILAGKKDKYAQSVWELVRSLGLSDSVVLPGLHSHVTDEQTIALRQDALAYVFPSLKEGFSLTPLEAQAFGLPCVISNIPVHREIYGESVLYFDPENIQDMAKKIIEVLENNELRKRLVSAGYIQVTKYDWTETARITLAQLFAK